MLLRGILSGFGCGESAKWHVLAGRSIGKSVPILLILTMRNDVVASIGNRCGNLVAINVFPSELRAFTRTRLLPALLRPVAASILGLLNRAIHKSLDQFRVGL